MPFFKPNQPILQKKQLSLNPHSLSPMSCLTIPFLQKFSLSGIYTCIDQAMLVWGILAGIIFFTAQYLPFDWMTQAIFWSVFTIIAIIVTIILTYSWTLWEKIAPLLYVWILLMVSGIFITDASILYHWGFILGHLCHLWLMLCVIGYFFTGIVMRSRAFFLASMIHGLAVIILPLLINWQFGFTGLVMMTNLLIFSEAQWDMLLPRELTEFSSPKVRDNFHPSSIYIIRG